MRLIITRHLSDNQVIIRFNNSLVNKFNDAKSMFEYMVWDLLGDDYLCKVYTDDKVDTKFYNYYATSLDDLATYIKTIKLKHWVETTKLVSANDYYEIHLSEELEVTTKFSDNDVYGPHTFFEFTSINETVKPNLRSIKHKMREAGIFCDISINDHIYVSGEAFMERIDHEIFVLRKKTVKVVKTKEYIF